MEMKKQMREGKKNIRIEEGNIIDCLAAILIVFFIFAMILAYSAYGKITQERLLIDQRAKEYLYRMEEYGYIKEGDPDESHAPSTNELIQELADMGVTVTIDDATTTEQAGYGDKVTLAFNSVFPNPLFVTFGQASMFKILGFNNTISYFVTMSSTAKW